MSKRGNIFDQGKPENPYNERDEGPVEAQRATAAQLAARKIKTLKGPRRAPSSSSGLSQSASFGMPQQQQPQAQSSGFNFGATAPIANSSTNSFGFGSQQQPAPGGGGFGGNATNSFPPAQAPAPNNAFSNSSFPAFGADNANAFNPQPPSANAFNFSAGGANPFASSTAAPATNGAGSSAFSGSVFNMPPATSQPASNPFNFGGAQSNNPVSTATSSSIFGSTAAPPTNLFGAISSGAPASNLATSAPQSNIFGGLGATSNAPSSAASGGLFNFGQNNTPSREASPAPAASGGLFNFGQNNTPSREASPAPPAASGGLFNFGQNNAPSREASPAPAASGGLFNFGQKNTPSRESSPAPPSNPFGSANASTPAPQGNSFNFGPTTQGTPAAPMSDQTPKFSFGQTPTANNATTTVPESTPFKASTAPASNPFNFGSTTPKPESQPQSSLFNFGTPKASESTAPKTGLFASAKSGTPTQPAPGGPFGQSQQPTEPESVVQNGTSTAVEYPSLNAPLEATKTPFSFTPQKTFGNSTNNAPVATPSLAPPKANPFANLARSPSPSKEVAPSTPSLPPPKANAFASLARSKSPTKEAAPTPSQPTTKVNAFASLSPAPAPTTPASTMPTLTGATAAPSEVAKDFEMPKIPKAHVPATWPKASVGNTALSSNMDQLARGLVELGAELSTLNQRYREKINSMPTMADWSALSSWHSEETSKVVDKIIAVKKQRAAANGITGYESTLSTKRKVTEETSQDDESTTTPTKRFRGGDATSTPPPQQPALFSTTPKNNPPSSNTSNLFGSIINSAPASTSATPSSSLFANAGPKTSATPSSGFQAPPFTSTGSVASAKKDVPSQSGFQFDSSSSTSSKNDSVPKPGFQVPAFGKPNGESKSNISKTAQGGFQMPSFGGAAGTNFANQFAKKAKTVEQLAAERKQKAKDEDYDSDDETEEQWDARYEAQEAARKAEEERKIKAASGFKLSPAEPAIGSSAPKPSFSFPKPASGTSTPGPFASRSGSPAPSTSGGLSVFDTPPASNTPAPNIFGHLSSGPSSNDQDESSSEDDGDQTEGQSHADQPTNSARSTPPPTRKFAQQDSGSESEEDSMRRQKQGNTSAKPSLLSRMTRADDIETSDAEKDKGQSKNGTSVFAQSNGVQTPAAKSSFFFDFANAGAKTAPPKDQTFKEGTPIKFGAAPATETKALPSFQFLPATPSPAEFSSTPTKPAPFSFLSATNLSSGPGSVSGLSSRAGTPSSEVENSAAENDDEEGSKQEQLDLSDLTDVEKEKYDVVFHAEVALAKRPSEKEGVKGWESFARGPLWILKDKETGKALLRIRIPSGKTPVNYNLLPKLQAKAAGSSTKMIFASYPNEEGKITNIIFAMKNPENAIGLLDAYNSNLPS